MLNIREPCNQTVRYFDCPGLGHVSNPEPIATAKSPELFDHAYLEPS